MKSNIAVSFYPCNCWVYSAFKIYLLKKNEKLVKSTIQFRFFGWSSYSIQRVSSIGAVTFPGDFATKTFPESVAMRPSTPQCHVGNNCSFYGLLQRLLLTIYFLLYTLIFSRFHSDNRKLYLLFRSNYCYYYIQVSSSPVNTDSSSD